MKEIVFALCSVAGIATVVWLLVLLRKEGR